jgi:threonine dehydratase
MTVVLEDVKKAYNTLKGSVKRTALADCPALSEITGNEVYLKLENLQKTGSFKIRGALNKISNLTEDEKSKGVIASSAGNHAQGVALGAKAMGIKATIVMPKNAPLAKISATRGYGAEVILHGPVYDDAYEKACEIQKATGATFIHPFDDECVIAGQGTVALEILEDLKDVDVIVVPVGGGGLLAGIAVAVKSINPDIKVIGVEASNAASMKAAIQKGYVHGIKTNATIADGIAVRKAGELTYGLIKEYVDEIVTVTESEIAQAILFLIEKNRVVTEGAGAASLAAILSGKLEMTGKKIVSIISGGNIDVNFMERILNEALIKEGRRFRFRVDIPDRAGALQDLLQGITNQNANIIQIYQSMFRENLEIGKYEMDLVIECADMEHREIIKRELIDAGYDIY